MNTDRELLEQAAKAAGIDLSTRKWHGCWYVSQEPNVKNWNPLVDDGDALRLAVKLGLRVKVEQNDHAEVDDGNNNSPVCWQAVNTRWDIYAATRRAIVRAAAEVGKAMPLAASKTSPGSM